MLRQANTRSGKGMRYFPTLIAITLFFLSSSSYAAIDNSGLLDTVLTRYSDAASTWADEITLRATWLFWFLVPMSMVWTFGFMALRRADLGEFFAEFIRFTIFTGFFWWLLINGPDFANSIILSMRQIGGNATGSGHALSPSGIVDIGFVVLDRVLSESSLWSPVDSAVGIIIALIILVVLALIGVNMLLLLISGWILAYAGIFYLGFGGSRWTSDIAINYFKTVLGIAMQLLTMVLLVGIGQSILGEYYSNMSGGVEFGEMAVLLIVSIVLLSLVNKLPQLVAGVITGASVGGQGIGSFGAGAAIGAAGALGAAAAVGGAMTAATASQAAGGANAIMSAISKAQENVAAGNDILSSFGRGESQSTGATGGGGSNGVTPFSAAAGFTSAEGTSSIASATSMSNTDMSADTSPTPTSTASNAGGTVAGSSSDGTATQSESIASATSMSNTDMSADTSPTETENNNESNQSESSTGSQRGGIGSALAKAGRIAADASANLARGTGDVAKEKASNRLDAIKERVSGTIGGQIASAIKAHESGPSFEENSISGETQVDAENEIAAFRDRNNSET